MAPVTPHRCSLSGVDQADADARRSGLLLRLRGAVHDQVPRQVAGRPALWRLRAGSPSLNWQLPP
eukprot:2497056-Prymnesium_polylepis.1